MTSPSGPVTHGLAWASGADTALAIDSSNEGGGGEGRLRDVTSGGTSGFAWRRKEGGDNKLEKGTERCHAGETGE